MAALLAVIFLAANFIPNIWDAFQFTGVICPGLPGIVMAYCGGKRRGSVHRRLFVILGCLEAKYFLKVSR
jgi:peptidoglycan/LPS O-acetylase OafA/YrhL